jgi:hypothetical protein
MANVSSPTIGSFVVTVLVRSAWLAISRAVGPLKG